MSSEQPLLTLCPEEAEELGVDRIVDDIDTHTVTIYTAGDLPVSKQIAILNRLRIDCNRVVRFEATVYPPLRCPACDIELLDGTQCTCLDYDTPIA